MCVLRLVSQDNILFVKEYKMEDPFPQFPSPPLEAVITLEIMNSFLSCCKMIMPSLLHN